MKGKVIKSKPYNIVVKPKYEGKFKNIVVTMESSKIFQNDTKTDKNMVGTSIVDIEPLEQ
jgi:hypothetical protein